MLTPQRDAAAIKLNTRLAVVNTKILVLEAQRANYGALNAGAYEEWSGHALLAQFTREREELESEIAKRR